MDREPAPAVPDPYAARPSARDIYELLRLPALVATLTAVATWLIWYYTNTSCTPELATVIGCNPTTIARYINIEVYGKMLTLSAITGAAGGVWNYDMFTKMRAAIAAERARADEAVKQLAEFRRQAEEERRQRDEERRLEDEERRQRDEERRLEDEERRRQAEEERRERDEERRQERESFMAMLAEERRRSDQNQQAFMAGLSEITAQMAHLVQQRNGDNGNGH